MAPRAQSFTVLGAVLAEMDVDDRAPRTGDTALSPLSDGGVATGFMSGLWIEGDEVSEGGLLTALPLPLPLLLREVTRQHHALPQSLRSLVWPGGSRLGQRREDGRTYENLPAACFVTAATTPPLSFAFFLSFFEAASGTEPSARGASRRDLRERGGERADIRGMKR